MGEGYKEDFGERSQNFIDRKQKWFEILHKNEYGIFKFKSLMKEI